MVLSCPSLGQRQCDVRDFARSEAFDRLAANGVHGPDTPSDRSQAIACVRDINSGRVRCLTGAIEKFCHSTRWIALDRRLKDPALFDTESNFGLAAALRAHCSSMRRIASDSWMRNALASAKTAAWSKSRRNTADARSDRRW